MAANGGPPPLPPASRTRITTIAGSPAQLVEDTFQLLADSPVVTAWPFVNWTFTSDAAAPPNRPASAPRSHLMGPIAMCARRPADSDMANLEAMDFLTHEMDDDFGASLLRQMDSANAFDKVFETERAWRLAVPSLRSLVSDPTAMQLPTLCL